jgi:hypothetical protein
VYAIQENNVVCVIVQSYPDIFYRNSLSNGLVLITGVHRRRGECRIVQLWAVLWQSHGGDVEQIQDDQFEQSQL